MYRGSARRMLGQYSMAVKDLNISFQLDSSSYMIYRYYGKLYIDEQDYPTALRYFDKAIHIDGREKSRVDDILAYKGQIIGLSNDHHLK